MAYCEECGGLGEACDDCVVGPLRDKIAALEAERDELKERFDNFVRDCGATCWTCDECGHSRDGRGCLVCESRELAAKVERLTRRGFEDLTHDNRELKRQNEDMAARLRAMLSAVNAVTAPWRHGCDIRTEKMDALCDRQVEVENGPVPECRACAEMREYMGQFSPYYGGAALAGVRSIIARHAADEGEG